MLNADWLVQVYAHDKDGDPCIGTGYSIGNGLVLTASHVVRSKNRADNPQLKLVWPEQDKHEMPFADADIVFDGGKDLDIAVIRCSQETPFKPPKIEWLLTDPMLNAAWASRGFPRAGKELTTRDDLGVPGKVAGLKKHVVELTTEVDATEANGWAGFSGAPVFIGQQLVAVITHDYLTLERYFKAVSIPWLLRENQDFQKAVGYTVTRKLPLETGNFKKELARRIFNELRHADARPLLESLQEELWLEELTGKEALSGVADKLLSQEVDKAIRDYLTPATTGCIHPDGFRYESSHDRIANIKKIAEEIMGWLVLSSADEKEIARLFPSGVDGDSLYFVLGHVNTLGGVELVLSRRFQRKSSWTGRESSSQHCPHHIAVDPAFFSESDDEVVRKLLLEIWNTVFDSPQERKKSHEKLNPDNVKLLNETLRDLRERKKDTEHYYIAFKLEAIEPDRVKAIYSKLLAKDKLNEMTVVELGSCEGSKVLILDEQRVIAAINGFYRAVNKHEKRQEQAAA